MATLLLSMPMPGRTVTSKVIVPDASAASVSRHQVSVVGGPASYTGSPQPGWLDKPS
jgi:hypothetical protein